MTKRQSKQVKASYQGDQVPQIGENVKRKVRGMLDRGEPIAAVTQKVAFWVGQSLSEEVVRELAAGVDLDGSVDDQDQDLAVSPEELDSGSSLSDGGDSEGGIGATQDSNA